MIYFKQILSTLLLVTICAFGLNAQDDMTKEQMLAKKAELNAEAAKYAGEAAAIQAKIDALPGWRTGFVGTVGIGLNGNNNWFALTTPDASSNTIGLGINAFANNVQPKYFWNNLLNVTIQRSSTKIDNNDNTSPVIALAEGLDLSSLYGYRITKTLALSVEGKFTSSIIQFDPDTERYSASLFNPAKLTASAGITYTGVPNLVVILHPLGYERNFPGTLISTTGAKLGATYAATIWKGIAWSSNLSAFIPYTNGAGVVDYAAADGTTTSVNYSAAELFNYTWLNGFSMKVFNGITVALNVGLRGDNQIADKGKVALGSELPLKGLQFQSYYTLGVGYTF